MSNSTPRIYPSLLPSVPVVNRSIFTFLFEQVYNPEEASTPAYIDFASGLSLSRGDVKHLSLSLAKGLRTGILLPSLEFPASSQKYTALGRGDTVMIFSPNSISWPVVLFRCVGRLFEAFRTELTIFQLHRSWIQNHVPGVHFDCPRALVAVSDSRPRAVFAAKALVPTVMAMFKLLGVSDDEAARRVFIMDLDFDRLKGGEHVEDSNSGHLRSLRDFVGDQELQRGELFEGEVAEETVFLCYSSDTTVRMVPA